MLPCAKIGTTKCLSSEMSLRGTDYGTGTDGSKSSLTVHARVPIPRKGSARFTLPTAITNSQKHRSLPGDVSTALRFAQHDIFKSIKMSFLAACVRAQASLIVQTHFCCKA